MRIAIIDCGTNTFHLLIVEKNGSEQQILHKEKRFVKLAEFGIEVIAPEPYNRALLCLKDYQEISENFKVLQIKAFGTAALRQAANTNHFIEEVKAETGILIDVISGNQEAELIMKGVVKAIPNQYHPFLIMDIGGGSTELIIVNQNEIKWKHSFQMGATTLKNKYHSIDPIPEQSIIELEQYIESRLSRWENIFKAYQLHLLVGASGSFDTIAQIIALKNGKTEQLNDLNYWEIPLTDYLELHRSLLKSTQEERLLIPGMHPKRAELMVIGSILIKKVLQLTGIEKIMLSKFALKEGVLSEINL